MAREVIECFAPVPAGLVVDATVGGAGHSRLLLEARPDLRVLGIDRDGDAVEAARRSTLFHGSCDGFHDDDHLERAVCGRGM
jgi:16S rRNA C1402 N4-methylase RsmH